ncbi:hypothetical protein [Methanosarcina acetivorans]|uniref:hypothetical protein n=1 Tax=Methanosarcina acetivorans TaxID=2214 RepID=UPI000AF00E05|nr:hypothetical protein [Methanosarcina acetivorans]
MQATNVTFKPSTVVYFKNLFSENKNIVEQMLRSEDLMERAIAKTIMTAAGVT